MSRWRVGLLLALWILPVAVLAGCGAYFLWERHWSFWAWWPLAGCLALSYALAWYWHRQRVLLSPAAVLDTAWTDRDRQAMELVKARAGKAAELHPERVGDPALYWQTATELAQELAHLYSPGVADPISALTIPEMLAVIELAAHELAVEVNRVLPAGHLLTIANWRQMRQAAEWYRTASNAYWIVAAIFAPVETGMRYAAAKFGIGQPFKLLQQDLLMWFYVEYVNRLGKYLIEVYSGRLRIGATRYRELRETHLDQPQAAAGPVTIAVIGQTKAGKSSLINALLGQRQAAADVVPTTDAVTRYELKPPGDGERLVFLDTPGYGHEGPRADQVAATCAAARDADILLLVLHARNPARKADLDMLDKLQTWFRANPERKQPPILAVLSHIDLLTPAMEWGPPYDWKNPAKTKETQISQALAAAEEPLRGQIAAIVPVCTLPGKEYGLLEWLLPAISSLIGEGRAVGFLRCLQAESDAGKLRKVVGQLAAAGSELLRHFAEGWKK